jgi:probable HAF family extracellular repeat protein
MKFFLTLSIILVFAIRTPIPAQQYEVIDLATLGGAFSEAHAINESGIIAGWATGTSSGHPVLWMGDSIIQVLDNPPGYAGEAVAVNNLGQIAVTGETNPQSYKAFLWENNTYTDLGVLPGRNESIAEDIDSRGRIIGRSFTLGAGNSAGFIWDAGVMTDLGTLGGSTNAYAINELGQIVGRSFADQPGGTQRARAFLWENNVMTALDPLPNESSSQAFGINDSGDIVGSSWHTIIPQFLAVDQATLWRNGGTETVDLGRTPGPPVCQPNFPFYTDNIARAINNQGQIVGHAQCISSGAAKAAFLWDNGVMYNLNDLIPPGSGWDLLRANDINDEGKIVGIGINPAGDLHGFLLVPDEPTAINYSEIPTRYTLNQNYPNPFNPRTNIEFYLPTSSEVTLKIFNMLGEEVTTLASETLSTGSHTYTWDASGYASGTYLYRLEAEGSIETRKMILMK